TTQRDDNLRSIQKHGRIGWQRRSGYGRRSLLETAMYRYKTIIGRRLHTRTLPNQRTEAKIACNVLNRMTRLGMPTFVRIQEGASPRGRCSPTYIHAPTPRTSNLARCSFD